MKEFEILSIMFDNIEFQRTIISSFEEKDFNEYRHIYTLFKSYFNKHMKPLDFNTFRFIIESNKDNPKVNHKIIERFLSEYANSYNKDVFNVDVDILLKEAELYLIKEQLKRQGTLISAAINDVNENNLNEIKENLYMSTQSVVSTSLLNKNEDEIDYLENLEERFQELENAESNGFLTTCDALNKYVIEKNGFLDETLTIVVAPPHTGKCVIGNTEILIRKTTENQEIIKKILIADLYKEYEQYAKEIKDKKFTNLIDVSKFEIEVWGVIGFQKIKNIGKTHKMQKWHIVLDNDTELYCADEHIVGTVLGDKKIKELNIYDGIITKNLFSPVVVIEKCIDENTHTEIYEEMYDLEIEENIMRYTFDKNAQVKHFDGKITFMSDLKKGDRLMVGTSECFIQNILFEKNNVIIDVDVSDHHYFTNDILSHNTLFLTAIAADGLRQKKNVLYITLEMSETEIASRIDANICGIPTNSIKINKDSIINTLTKMKASLGRLKIKKYATHTCSTMDIKNYLSHLKSKFNFKVDILIVDQISAMKSLSTEKGSYEKGKQIVVGLKTITQEEKLKGFTATQAGKSSLKNENGVEMDDTSESFAIPAMADICFGAVKYNKLSKERFQKIKWNCFKNRTTGVLDSCDIIIDTYTMKIMND